MTAYLFTRLHSRRGSALRFIILMALLALLGCASQQPQQTNAAATPPEPESRRLAEEFDPQLLDEDMLLIQPNFAPSDALVVAQPASKPAPQPARETRPPLSGDASSGQSPASERTVFRVQVFALSHLDIAEQKRAELEGLLGVPVQILSRRGLHLIQAGSFADALPLTGVLLTKLDGTARGGIVVSIQQKLGIPVVALGVGEDAPDLLEFDPRAFVEALLEE